MVEYGVSNNLLPEFDLATLANLAEGRGLTWLEVRLNRLDDLSKNSAGHVREVLDQHALLCSVHAAYRGVNMCALTPAQFRRHLQEIEFAHLVGADRVVFHLDYAVGEPSRAMRRSVEALKRYVATCEDYGLLLLVENVRAKEGKLGRQPEELKEVVEAVNHPHLQVALDVPNAYENRGTAWHHVKVLNPHVVHVHLNAGPAVRLGVSTEEFAREVADELAALEHRDEVPVVFEGKFPFEEKMRFLRLVDRALDPSVRRARRPTFEGP
ncbi:MAG: hypothetical protein Kow0069_09140 [Promethearchaeota archaeon]